MQQGWNLADEGEWEKIRFECYHIANGQFFSKPVRDIKTIINLPSIDGDAKKQYEIIRAKLEEKRQMLNAKHSPAN